MVTYAPAIIIGDVNGNTKVNAENALIVLKHVAKIELIEENSIFLVDINEDESVDVKDVLEILKISDKL